MGAKTIDELDSILPIEIDSTVDAIPLSHVADGTTRKMTFSSLNEVLTSSPSIYYGTFIGSASYAGTAAVALTTISTVTSASYASSSLFAVSSSRAVSASFATVAGVALTTLTTVTSASYAATASVAFTTIATITSASYAATASFISNLTGQTNYVPKFTSISQISSSQIYDDGTYVGVGTNAPSQKLDVNGTARLRGKLYDYTNSTGSLFYVLASTSNGVEWRSPTTASLSSPYNGVFQINGQAWSTAYVPGGGITGATSVDFNNSNSHTYTLTGDTTISFQNAKAGATYIIVIRQSVGGGNTVTWPAGILWANGISPIMTTVASKYDIYSFIYDGINYYGSFSQNYG
jgi:hypothetical protein